MPIASPSTQTPVVIRRHGCARVLPLTLLLLLVVSAAATASTDRYQAQRKAFEKVLQAQEAGKHSLAGKLALGLEDYPLYPYFTYNDLHRRLQRYPSEEVDRFLTTYDHSYLASRLRTRWLEQLGDAGRWSEFLRFYRPDNDAELRCRQLNARLQTGLTENLLVDTRAVWLSPASLPKSCDAVFARLYASELMNDDLVWARFTLAMEAGKSALARYLSKRLAGADKRATASLWLDAHTTPATVLARGDLIDDPVNRKIVLHALARLARQDVDAAIRQWAAMQQRVTFDPETDATATAIIALAAARNDHADTINLLDQVADSAVTPDVQRYRLREGIRARAWVQLARWTATEPAPDINVLRWRYWRARALRETGETGAAQPILQALATERDYYGYMAADLLQRPYALNNHPIAPDAVELAAMETTPGIARAHELMRLTRTTQARREWRHELAPMTPRQLEVAAYVAAQWGWHDTAISALGQARSYDDLDLRFPLLYADLAREYAAKRNMSAARIMAIMRSESAFVADARSGAGALGLMQLLPGTARETAQQIGLKLPNTRKLFDPRTNIALGSAYLARMLARLDGNFAMAAAAYNAGPHRVRQWRQTACIPADIWIDTIPFTETRRYVRRAYFYTAIYESRLGQEMTRIDTVMPPIPASGANAGCQP